MTEPPAFEVSAPLWQHEGGTWRFVTIPADVSDDISDLAEGHSHGFGSVRVRVLVGRTEWMTSLFPSAEMGAYVLPVKKAVRTAENLFDGASVVMRLELVDL